MTHLIIYDNRTGYRFYEASRNFPEQYKRGIAEICGALTCGDRDSIGKPALRYTPLQDRFLLSVIFRCPDGSEFHHRSLYIVVNFLMDADDADDFFSYPFSRVHDVVIQYAASLYTQYANKKQDLPTGLPLEHWEQFLDSSNHPPFYGEFNRLTHIDLHAWRICQKSPSYPKPMAPKNVVMPLSWLLSSVLYHKYAVSHQVYVGSHTLPSWEIQLLQEALPAKLRKDMTFHTALVSDQESHGITLNFSSVEQLQTIQTGEFQGGTASTTKHIFFADGISAKAEKDTSPAEQQFHPSSEKIAQMISQLPFGIYQVIAKSITTWEEFLELAKLNDREDILPQIFQIIPKERLYEQKRNSKLTDQEESEWEWALRTANRKSWDDSSSALPDFYSQSQDTDPSPVSPEPAPSAEKNHKKKNAFARHTYRRRTFPLVCSFLAILAGSIGLLLVLLGKYSVTSQSFPEKLVIEISAVATASLLETLVTILCTVFLTLGISRLTQHLRNK